MYEPLIPKPKNALVIKPLESYQSENPPRFKAVMLRNATTKANAFIGIEEGVLVIYVEDKEKVK